MGHFVVLEHAGAEELRRAGATARAQGRTVVEGWRPVPGGVCIGTVAGEDDAAAAVLAGVAGADLVVAAAAAREVVDRLCDDLRRLGQVEHRLGPPSAGALTPEEEALLALLLGGAGLGEAARALHISRRTADRRLAHARAVLGSASTAEALRAAARRGLRPQPR